MRDGLTGILNRRAFDNDLQKSLKNYREKALQLVTEAMAKDLRTMNSLYR